MPKTIFVSNRLPVTVRYQNRKFSYEESIGGLATGLKREHEKEGLWIGWSGLSKERMKGHQKTITEKLYKDYRCVPVSLSDRDVKLYYEGFSNQTIWPLFHYFPALTIFDSKMWARYQRVNQTFYDTLKPYIQEDSLIWIHDYQLMLLPELIRQDFPNVKIGFFLHIPFPSSEIFRLLVWKHSILKGILGADLIGFHTYDYVRHFLSSVRRILNIEHNYYKLQYNNRTIEVDAYPMGINYEYFAKQRDLVKTKQSYRIILSVDRLDYTKGILERIHGYQTFLTKYPKYHKQVKLHLIVAPSRQSLPTYDRLSRDIEHLVSQINGKFGSFDWMPIWYLYQSFDQDDLIKRYKESDVLLVTPLRDGMNLIAKEYIASRTDRQGMLILSETAGAASELSESIIVNPNDDNQIAESIKYALEMPKQEQMARNDIMHKRLERYNVSFWAKSFIDRLSNVQDLKLKQKEIKLLDDKKILDAYQRSQKRLIFLDYDGTLVEFMDNPMQAYPNRALIKLLTALSKNDKNDVVIISGRDHDTLESWLGKLNVRLVGDHGLWYKYKKQGWQQTILVESAWKPSIRHILERFVDRMPGSFIEEKTNSLALHYRKSEPEMVAVKMPEIKDALFSIKGTNPIAIQSGNMVIEVKDQRVNKGIATRLFDVDDYDFVFVAGDDTTDEDMFTALPNAHQVKVGFGQTIAPSRVETPSDLRDVLKKMIKMDKGD